MLKKYDNKKYEWYRDILSQLILISGILLVPISIEDVFQCEIIIFSASNNKKDKVDNINDMIYMIYMIYQY